VNLLIDPFFLKEGTQFQYHLQNDKIIVEMLIAFITDVKIYWELVEELLELKSVKI